MPKISKKQIDEDEKKVIAQLQKNPRESINEIAKKCGFSRQKVWRIINKLEKDKAIWGYNAVIDDEKTGRKRFFVLLKRSLKPATEEKVNIVVKRDLRKIGTELGVELEGSYYINGVYDWLMCITANNINQVKRFCDSFSTVFKGTYVSDIHILEVMFPIERNGFDNPNREDLKKFF